MRKFGLFLLILTLGWQDGVSFAPAAISSVYAERDVSVTMVFDVPSIKPGVLDWPQDPQIIIQSFSNCQNAGAISAFSLVANLNQSGVCPQSVQVEKVAQTGSSRPVLLVADRMPGAWQVKLKVKYAEEKFAVPIHGKNDFLVFSLASGRDLLLFAQKFFLVLIDRKEPGFAFSGREYFNRRFPQYLEEMRC